MAESYPNGCFQKAGFQGVSKGVIVWEWVNHVISDISVVSRDTGLTFSDSIQTGVAVETRIVRVVSSSIKEITGIT